MAGAQREVWIGTQLGPNFSGGCNMVVNELVRVAYRGLGPVFASPVVCVRGRVLSWAATAARSLAVCTDRQVGALG